MLHKKSLKLRQAPQRKCAQCTWYIYNKIVLWYLRKRWASGINYISYIFLRIDTRGVLFIYRYRHLCDVLVSWNRKIRCILRLCWQISETSVRTRIDPGTPDTMSYHLIDWAARAFDKNQSQNDLWEVALGHIFRCCCLFSHGIILLCSIILLASWGPNQYKDNI